MLTRLLMLSAGWLALSFIVTMMRGTKVKTASRFRSLLWLVVVILCGDLWALLSFGYPLEIALLSFVAFVFGCWIIWKLPDWNGLGHVLWTMSILTTVLFIAYSFGITAFTPLHPVAFIVALSLTFVEVAALGLALSYAFESLDVCCRVRWRRQFHPLNPLPGYMPKVSLQVPAYNEPPEVVGATLRSLAALDYPNFEVLVIDNNTPREKAWRPLEKLCDELGPNFRFLHLDKWPGYKSGALNFALTQTDPEAEIISIIDADYRVSPDFLRDLTPYFADPNIAFVQTPQDYRDYRGNSYLEAILNGYKYFFAVSMPSRNERNAIIFAGTMGLIRRSVLQEIGGWDEWCITEDAEASLRVLKRGYQSVFVNRPYGTGLMPYSFDGLKKQRFRWCFGGIQILKKHWESLMPWARWTEPDNRLTFAQRYYYLLGGLQWFNEPLNLFFTIFLMMGAVIHLSPGGGILRPLTGPLIVIPAIFLGIGMWRFLWVLRSTLKLSLTDGIRAMAHFFSLGWAVTLGCIQGLIQPAGVFMRTPKSKSKSNLIRALLATQWETLIGVACLFFALVVNLRQPSPATAFLGVLLLWQGSLYLSAPYFSLFSTRVHQPRPREHVRGIGVNESRAAGFALAMVAGLMIGIAGAMLLPPPAETPRYAELQPQDIQVRQLVGLPPLPTATRIPTDPVVLPPASPTPLPTSTIAGTVAPTVSPPPPEATTPVSSPAVTAAPSETPLPTTTALPTLPPATATQVPPTPVPPTPIPPTPIPPTPVPPTPVPPTPVPPTPIPPTPVPPTPVPPTPIPPTPAP